MNSLMLSNSSDSRHGKLVSSAELWELLAAWKVFKDLITRLNISLFDFKHHYLEKNQNPQHNTQYSEAFHSCSFQMNWNVTQLLTYN